VEGLDGSHRHRAKLAKRKVTWITELNQLTAIKNESDI